MSLSTGQAAGAAKSVAARGIGLVSEVQWVQKAGPATPPTGLLISGSKGVALARLHGASQMLSDARLLSRVWSVSRINVSNNGHRVALQPKRGELRLFSIDRGARMVYRSVFAASEDPDKHAARYSENGNFVVMPTPEGLTVRDARTGELVSEWSSGGGRYTLSDDGTLIFANEQGLFSVPPRTMGISIPRFIPVAGITLDNLRDDLDFVTAKWRERGRARDRG